MDNNNLEIGKIYSLKYLHPWTDYDVKDVKIAGVTKESETESFGSDSIFSEFFSRFGLGISSFTSMILVSPDMYICEPVDSRDPIEIDESTILIPKLIIDFNKSEELLICDDISLTIDGLLIYHDLVYERGTFLRNLTANIKDILKNTKEYGDIPVNINYETADILKPKSEYIKFESFKKETYKLQKIANDEIRRRHNENLRLLMEKSDNLDKEKNNINILRNELESVISEFNESKNIYDSMRDIILLNVTQLFNGLEDNSIIVGDGNYSSHKTNILKALE